MKFVSMVFWIFSAILLFPFIFLAVNVYPSWEKMADSNNAIVIIFWIILAPLMVLCVKISSDVYSKWEAWGENF